MLSKTNKNLVSTDLRVKESIGSWEGVGWRKIVSARGSSGKIQGPDKINGKG